MWVATLGWILVSLIGAVPFFYLARRLLTEQVAVHQLTPFANFLNAAFESVSGYTSTGLTVTPSERSLPYTLQWWRSFLQWVGGVGIIVFISALHPGLASVSAHYSSENDQEGEEEKKQQKEQEENDEEETLPNVSVSWTKIWWIYVIFSLAGIGLLWIQGIPWWEAINHGMTAISTGGFSVNDQSLQGYSGRATWTVIAIIIIGSLNFNLYHQWFTRAEWRKFFTNQQHLGFVVLLIVGTFVLYYENNVWAGGTTSWTDLAFQITSALGTCGFSTVSLRAWDTLPLLVLVSVMLIGGATSSTTGGVKIFRLILLIKGNIYGALCWIANPGRTLSLRFDNQVFSHEASLRLYRNVGVFFFLWIGTLVLTVVVLMHEVDSEYGLAEVLFETASALATTGLSIGITSAELSAIAKLCLMGTMLIGRLELMPVIIFLALFNPKASSLSTESSKPAIYLRRIG